MTAPLKVIKSDASGNTIETYQYGTESLDDQLGDVYYNSNWAPGSRPAIVVVHGGWWHNANRASGQRAAEKFYAAGFVVFNIDYRLAGGLRHPDGSINPGDRWPAQRIDVELAVRFIKSNAAQFGTSSTRLASYGFSAGGHIVTLAAGYYGSVKVAASVGAVLQPHRAADIAMNGVWGTDQATSTIVKSFGYMCSALGCSYEPTWGYVGDLWASFKPETYFGADRPAIYAIKGDKDPVEPASALTATEYWLTKAGQDHKTLLVAGRAHDENMILGTGADDVKRWNDLVAYIKARTA